MARAATEVEVRRIVEGLTLASEVGPRVFVTGHSSLPPSFALPPNVDLTREDSEMVARVRSSYRRAVKQGADVCLYSEPDKTYFFRSGLDRMVAIAEQNPQSLVIATRSDAAFATLPLGQRQLETKANQIGHDFLGPRVDYFFGPFAIPRTAVERYLDAFPDTIGWGWRTYLMGRCILAGMPVVGMDGTFDAPDWNREEDDPASRLYRLKQFVESVEGIRQALLDASRS
jgi:hypothetical protein